MNDDELDRRLAALPRAVNPRTDLWPEIAARVSRRRRHGTRPVLLPAVAAALVAAVALGIALLPAVDDPGLATDPALGTAFRSVVDARTDFGDETVELLRDQHAAGLDSLERLTAALERHPDDADLQRQLLDAYRGQVRHLDYLGRAPRGIF